MRGNKFKKQKSEKSKKRKLNIKEVYFKILQATRQENPNFDEKTVKDIAAKRTNTWISFLKQPEELGPLFSLFKDLGELHNLRIENVAVDYPVEPSIILHCVYKGKKTRGYLSYDEAVRELDFAIKNSVSGVEKFRDTMERLEMEMIDTRKVRKVGNSLVISIPESIISLFGLDEGDYLSFVYRFGEVKLKKERTLVMSE